MFAALIAQRVTNEPDGWAKFVIWANANSTIIFVIMGVIVSIAALKYIFSGDK